MVDFGPHHGKEEDFAEVFGTSEEHDEAVDSDSASAGGWHPAFEGEEELLVHGVGFVVAFVAFAELLFESFPLVDGVVDFAESVADFASEDVPFESAGESEAVGVFFGEGGCFYRVTDNERGLLEVGFDKVFEEFFDDSAEVVFLFGREADALHGGFGVVQVFEFAWGDTGAFLDGGHEIDAVPGFAEI